MLLRFTDEGVLRVIDEPVLVLDHADLGLRRIVAQLLGILSLPVNTRFLQRAVLHRQILVLRLVFGIRLSLDVLDR